VQVGNVPPNYNMTSSIATPLAEFLRQPDIKASPTQECARRKPDARLTALA